MRSLTVGLLLTLVAFLALGCTSTRSTKDPLAVIEAFHEALNEGDLDAAMSLVADDATVNFAATYTGKAEIRDLMQEGIEGGYHHELSDIRADGEKVTWTQTLTIGADTFVNLFEAVVQEGLIVTFTHIMR